MTKSFNLTTEPWIKVVEAKSNQTKTVSMIDLFENAHLYSRLAGEMRSQDLSLMRLLLAVLHTVYSRVNAIDQQYSWVNIDSKSLILNDSTEQVTPDIDDLLDTWQGIYDHGSFTKSVSQYLKANASYFDFFGSRPFYQVTETEYDSFVPKKKRVATGTGTVAIKQINRQISESANTPDIFAPKSGMAKNNVDLPELVRWLIMYQSFTGVTDKTKIETDEKFSTSAGWVYRLNPVFAKGSSLFETLMLNLNLADDRNLAPQKPVWEYETISQYIEERKKQLPPTNLAFLYTLWARLIHIEWGENNDPIIFSAGLPTFDSENVFLEPMTVWRKDSKASKGGADVFKPAVKGIRSLGIAMWRNFGQYINVDKADDNNQPGIVSWLQLLKNDNLIDRQKQLHLESVALISDGNATSQSPVMESCDDMKINADILFDSDEVDYWPERIEEEVDVTQKVGKNFWSFAANIATIRNLDSRDFAGKVSYMFYDQLNEPFKLWLASLSKQDDPDEKIDEWRNILKRIVINSTQQLLMSSSPRDVSGIIVDGKNDTRELLNIFTAKNQLMTKVYKDLHLQKG
ncbi:MAG TPA: type I-E CRISPR-associated protein Cse1/CasA [Lactobacillus sp.]|nr:type I-E CRISPR-associated protein Cse1/CasA [Lactobacillus sp.]